MRVLIADDQKSVGTSLAELVRRRQHEVVEVVASGLEAIHAYGRHHPDVVLMDYQIAPAPGRAYGRKPSQACAQATISAATARKLSICASRLEAGRAVTKSWMAKL
jgi:CheY-like chemotaxis protein